MQQPQTQRESEILAALLIEGGNAAAATTVLDQAAKPETSEQIRLRAIIACLGGDREGAVRLAAKASAGATPSFAAIQTNATLHVMAALAPGSELQFGAAPNPFNPSLVRVTASAVTHLDQALVLLDRQISIVDAHLAVDLELWKLAALLIHPTRTRDARAFADGLLERPVPDPVAVAWCQNCGFKLRVARIRKAYRDAIRTGQATPSHVIVLAMMKADRGNADDAAALIKKHRPLFKVADDFLEGWQKKFEGDPGSDPFAQAMHAAQRKNYAPLMAFAATPSCSANQLFAATDMLATSKQWAAINGLRKPLLTVATPRAIELAARAAVEVGSYSDAVEILDGALDQFPDRQLTEGLLYLRARANDNAGRKGAALSDLEVAARTSGDRFAAQQLVNSLIRIGDLKGARKHAEALVKMPAAKSGELLRLANTFKSLDPNFSRGLVKKVAARSKLPQQAVPALMKLANNLGLHQIEGRMMGMMAELTQSGSTESIMRFDTIEAVVAIMKKHGDKLQQEIDVWHAGMKPGHVTFAADPKCFTSLYLEHPADRQNALNKPLPMLLRAANAVPRSVEAPSNNGKPDLTIDISALLLAKRCNLIDAVETAFNVRIPEALPLALVVMEDEWPTHSTKAVALGRRWLSDSTTAVRVVSNCPEGAIPLGTDELPLELLQARLTSVCDAAIKHGNLSQAEAASVIASAVSERVATAPVAAIALQPWVLMRLAREGVLEPLARSVPTYITVSDRNALASDMARAERKNDVRRQLTELRELVADRLARNIWTTLPKSQDPSTNSRFQPHVVCLFEIIDAANAGNKSNIWAEDRALSRSRLPLLLNVSDIVRHLKDGGHLDAQRYWSIDQQLREMGHAFMPIEYEQIAKDVLAAPIVDGMLIETPELTKWRRWYAQEVEQLGYANHAPELDEDGRIAGEPRYLIELMAVARNVLAAIWSDVHSTDQDRRARSAWAWTCLRFEVTPAIQWSPANQAARRSLAATVLLHTADLPLMVRLKTETMPEDMHQPYMEWFIECILDGRCAIDPDLGDSFARQLALLMSPQLDIDPNEPQDLARAARVYMTQTFRRYLELFPEAWRDKIMAQHDLVAKLGTVWFMTLDVGATSIPVERIETAMIASVAVIDASGKGSAEVTLENGTTAIVAVCQDGTGAVSADVTVGSETAHLEPLLVAVTLADEPSRMRALMAAKGALDLSPDALEATMREIAAPTNITERIQRQKAAHDRDFMQRLAHVRRHLQHDHPIALSDLSLPEPEMIAQYLRLEDVYRQEPGTWLQEIATALPGELGIETAARRVGGLPFDLPDAFFASCAEHPVDPKQISSPAHARVYLKALQTKAGNEAKRDQIAVVLLDRLVRQAELMAALIWKGARQHYRSKDWRRLNPAIALSLLWVWADRLASNLAWTNIEADKVAADLRRSEPADLTHAFRHDGYPTWFEQFGFGIDATGLVAAIIGSTLHHVPLKNLPDELKDRMLKAIGTVGTTSWFPKFQIGFPLRAPSGLWIASDPVAGVIQSETTQVMQPFQARDPDGYVQALLHEPLNPEQPFLIPGMLSAADLSVVNTDTARAIVAHVDNLLVRFNNIANDPAYRHVQCIKAECLAIAGDHEAMRTVLRTAASSCAMIHGHQRSAYSVDHEHSTAQRDLVHLFEVALAFARHSPGSTASQIDVLGQLIEVVVDAWPNARYGAIEFMDRTTSLVQTAIAVSVWPSLVHLRTR